MTDTALGRWLCLCMQGLSITKKEKQDKLRAHLVSS